MKHKQFEFWILEDIELSEGQKKTLAQHLTECEECSRLYAGWMASKNLLQNAIEKTPKKGFSDRWRQTILIKQRAERIFKYRLTLLGFLMLTFITSVVILLANGSLEQMLARTLNNIAQLFLVITYGLSTFSFWIRQLPVYVPLALGFLILGFINAFLLTSVFMLWNLKNRKNLAYETNSN